MKVIDRSVFPDTDFVKFNYAPIDFEVDWTGEVEFVLSMTIDPKEDSQFLLTFNVNHTQQPSVYDTRELGLCINKIIYEPA